MRKVLIILGLFLLIGCATKEEQTKNENQVTNTTTSTEEVMSINETNLFNYLNQENVLYLDVREVSEYKEEHLKGFINLPFNSLILGSSKEGNTLFYGDNEPTFKESDAELEKFIPHDKEVYIMCRSGHRAGLFVDLLIARGYDPNKIHNVGGMMNYTDAAYEAYKTTDDGEYLSYDFAGLTRN